MKGLLIGNGWTDPATQYPAYASYAYERGLIKQGSEQAKPVENQLNICRNLMKTGVKVSMDQCEEVLNTILRVTRDEFSPFLRTILTSRHSDQGCLNMYDVRLRDTYPSCGMNWPPDLSDVTPYLRVPHLSFSKRLTLARRRRESPQHRHHQEKNRLDRMFRWRQRILPGSKLSPRNLPPPVPPRTRPDPALQRRSRSHM